MRTKVTEHPVIINGVQVGISMEMESEEGEPEYGRCVALDCPEIASEETLTGLHFCSNHFLGFYSDEPFGIDRLREFIET